MANLKFMIEVAKLLHDNDVILYGSFVRDWIVPKLDKKENIFKYNKEQIFIRDLNVRYFGNSTDFMKIFDETILVVFTYQLTAQTQKYEIHNLMERAKFTLTVSFGFPKDIRSKRRDFDVNTLTFQNNHLDIDNYEGCRGIDEVITNILNKEFRVIISFDILTNQEKCVFINRFIDMLKKGYRYPNIKLERFKSCNRIVCGRICKDYSIIEINDAKFRYCMSCVYKSNVLNSYLNY